MPHRWNNGYLKILSKILSKIKKMIFLLLKLKGALLGPIPSLAIEKSLKMVKIASYFTLKALLIYEVFTFLS